MINKKKSILIVIFTLLSLFSCSQFVYRPNKLVYSIPEKQGVVHEDIYFKSESGNVLHGWLLKSKMHPPKSTIVFFHGNAQNLSAHYYQIEWLTKYGHQVFIADYSGYGKSLGTPSQHVLLKDGRAFLNEGYKYHLRFKSKKFIVYGQSLGGAVLLPAVATYKNKGTIDQIIIESSFLSYKKIAFRILSSNFITFLISPLAYVLISNDVPPYKYLNSLDSIPLLVIYTKRDQVIPYDLTEEIYNKYEGPKKRLIFENYLHIQPFFDRVNRMKLLNYLN